MQMCDSVPQIHGKKKSHHAPPCSLCLISNSKVSLKESNTTTEAGINKFLQIHASEMEQSTKIM